MLFGVARLGGSAAFGTIYKANADGSGFAVLHNFGVVANDGQIGSEPVVLTKTGNSGGQALGRDGMLYGTTDGGGTNGMGTVYKLGQDGANYQVLHSFDSSGATPAAPLIQGNDGALYGTFSDELGSLLGGVFKLNTDGSGYAILKQFTNDVLAGVVQGVDGVLYGTSREGPNGIIFRVNTDGSSYTNLHALSSDGSEGGFVYGTLIQAASGFLFGTAFDGGAGTNGVIYMINTNGLGFQVVHSFADGTYPNDQAHPASGLTLGPGGWFYGTTAPVSGNGSVYQIAQDGTGYSQLYVFGSNPNGGITPKGPVVPGSSQGISGIIFGTGSEGGPFGLGAVFAIVINPPVSILPVTSPATGDGVSVFWPSWAAGFTLQSTTNVAIGTWVNVTNGIPVSGVQLPPPTNGATFYRLVSP